MYNSVTLSITQFTLLLIIEITMRVIFNMMYAIKIASYLR